MLNNKQNENYPDYNISEVLGYVKPPNIDFQFIINNLDCHREFYGAGIIYNDGINSFEVRPPKPGTNTVARKTTHVIITKVSTSLPDSVKKKLEVITTSSLLETEKTSFVLSCGAMVLWAVGTFLADAATVATLGGAAPLAVISTLGTIATGAQCVNSSLRLIDLNFNDGERVKWFDKQTWYLSTIAMLDLISLAGAGRDLYSTVKAYRTLKSASAAATAPLIKWLKGFTLAERIALSRGIIKHFNPKATEKQISMWLTAKKYPKAIDSEQVMLEINNYLNNTILTSIAYGGSAINGVISGAPFKAKKESIDTDHEYYAIGILRTEEVF